MTDLPKTRQAFEALEAKHDREWDEMMDQRARRRLHVDGMTREGTFMSCQEGEASVPFVVFDEDAQENIAGPFNTWKEAEAHRLHILSGGEPYLNSSEIRKYLDAWDRARS